MNSNFEKILAGALESSNTDIQWKWLINKTQQALMEMLEFCRVMWKLED